MILTHVPLLRPPRLGQAEQMLRLTAKGTSPGSGQLNPLGVYTAPNELMASHALQPSEGVSNKSTVLMSNQWQTNWIRLPPLMYNKVSEPSKMQGQEESPSGSWRDAPQGVTNQGNQYSVYVGVFLGAR